MDLLRKRAAQEVLLTGITPKRPRKSTTDGALNSFVARDHHSFDATATATAATATAAATPPTQPLVERLHDHHQLQDDHPHSSSTVAVEDTASLALNGHHQHHQHHHDVDHAAAATAASPSPPAPTDLEQQQHQQQQHEEHQVDASAHTPHQQHDAPLRHDHSHEISTTTTTIAASPTLEPASPAAASAPLPQPPPLQQPTMPLPPLSSTPSSSSSSAAAVAQATLQRVANERIETSSPLSLPLRPLGQTRAVSASTAALQPPSLGLHNLHNHPPLGVASPSPAPSSSLPPSSSSSSTTTTPPSPTSTAIAADSMLSNTEYINELPWIQTSNLLLQVLSSVFRQVADSSDKLDPAAIVVVDPRMYARHLRLKIDIDRASARKKKRKKIAVSMVPFPSGVYEYLFPRSIGDFRTVSKRSKCKNMMRTTNTHTVSSARLLDGVLGDEWDRQTFHVADSEEAGVEGILAVDKQTPIEIKYVVQEDKLACKFTVQYLDPLNGAVLW